MMRRSICLGCICESGFTVLRSAVSGLGFAEFGVEVDQVFVFCQEVVS